VKFEITNYCIQCGKVVKRDVDFCPFCNYRLVQEQTKKIQLNTEQEKIVEPINKDFIETNQIHTDVKPQIKTKRGSKYILTPSQRTIFLQKILPLILIGNITWLIGELFFEFIFSGVRFSELIGFYLFIVVIDIILFFSLNVISLKDMKVLGFIVYIIFTFTAGIITMPLVKLSNLLANQVHMFLFSALECTIIVALIGLSLKDKYFAEGYVGAHVILFILFLTIAEIIFLVIYNIQNFFLTIPISLSGLCVFSLVTMFFGAISIKKLEKHPWIFIAYKIVSIYVFIAFGTILVAIVILIIVVIAIILEDSNFGFPSWLHFSGWFWGPTPSSGIVREKKQEDRR